MLNEATMSGPADIFMFHFSPQAVEQVTEPLILSGISGKW
jgi:hypothetical protein